jgi:PPOX class probable F420-dependent enzyme
VQPRNRRPNAGEHVFGKCAILPNARRNANIGSRILAVVAEFNAAAHKRSPGYNPSAVILSATQEVFMAGAIPEKYADLFQKRAFANLGTLMPDGRPQVTPVWVDYDGEHVIFNSAKGRQKDRNVRRDPRVSMAISDPENPYRYLEIRGRVEEITEQGASEHIDKMAKKYLGVDKYPYAQAGEVRVMYKVKPEHTTTMG